MPSSARETVARVRARGRLGGVNPKVVTFGLLLSVGFASGFALSHEVSPPVRLSPAPPAKRAEGGGAVAVPGSAGGGRGSAQGGAPSGSGGQAGQGGAGRGGSGGSMRAQSGGSGGEGGGPPGGQNGGGAQGGAGAGAAASGGAAGAGAGQQPSAAGSARDAGEASAGQPCRSADVVGAEAAKFLSGNTADGLAGAGAGAELLFFSPRGWVGRMGASSIDARAWNADAETLCEPKPGRDGAPSCAVLHARKCLDGDPGALRLGELLRPGGRWIPVVRGRDRDFPGYLPLLDEARPAPRGKAGNPAESRRARGGEGFPGGTAYRVAAARGGPETLVVYAEDGRRFDLPRPSSEGLRRGLSIGVGWWTSAGGSVCQGEGSKGLHPACYKPRKGQDGRLTLVSTSGLPRIDLLALDDAGPLARGGD